ncbi:MAG: hypothetical protein J6U28_09345 [Bacteroidales bacterium]|nr:hypothetical protein [Bacteroidales bacterium]MBP5741172.1 hypothetical protein [Bacteroidales bacterium]
MKEIKQTFNVPEGYFDQLQKRLEAIPSEHPVVQTPAVTVPLWTRVRPYVALAACLVMAFFVGNFFLGRNQAPAESELFMQDYYYMADLIPVTNPYSIYDDSPMELYTPESSSEDDVIQYLISSGTSVDYIAYLLNE